MVEPIVTPRAILRRVISEVARERMVAPELIGGRSRQRNVLDARMVVARRLTARGMSEERVARMLHVSVPTLETFLKKGD